MLNSPWTKEDIRLFQSGEHCKLYNLFGSHLLRIDGEQGVYFSVWAPCAKSVELIGDFNSWDGSNFQLKQRNDNSGIWESFVPKLTIGVFYKYRIFSLLDKEIREKADPFARATELMPKSASVVNHSDYKWRDSRWMKSRKRKNALGAPVCIYELHIGSWKKKEGRSLYYHELVDDLVDYVKEMGFTHIELLPITEHPYYPSWGYLTSSYFAPTSRFGYPDDLRTLIDACHRSGIGLILDWVPGHFPNDAFALAEFDGSCLYEHPDRRKGYHAGWDSLVFNYERGEVRSFLLSSAHFWLEHYHFDGIRVDAVSSMIYLNYGRSDGEWEPNKNGGNENLAAISFLQEFNRSIYREFPDVQTIAEESTTYPGMTSPTDQGGLGFGLKWMMGWMNDMLSYMKREPIYREWHHHELTLSIAYAYTENFVLPFSHDEVVHGKASMVYKMPGDEWQKMAQLRLLLGYMYTHPGQKLLFMGTEFGQTSEWDFNSELDWDLLQFPIHAQMQAYTKALNSIYRKDKALHQLDFSWKGFEWIDFQDKENTVLCYLRKSKRRKLIVICNFSPNALENYQLGVPKSVAWLELFNSDDRQFGGSGVNNVGSIKTSAEAYHNQNHSIRLRVPPYAMMILEPVKSAKTTKK